MKSEKKVNCQPTEAKYKITEDLRCLECGDYMKYARPDKKFCSIQCKNKYNYEKHKQEKLIRTRIISALEKNHDILTNLLSQNRKTIRLSDIILLGFNSDFITSYRKHRPHDEYCCFDIRYNMSCSRIFNIEKAAVVK